MPLLSFLTLITVIQYIVVCVRFFDVDGHVHLILQTCNVQGKFQGKQSLSYGPLVNLWRWQISSLAMLK